jgi:hypothetical protein
MDVLKKFLIVFEIISLVCLSSCVKEVDCSGLPQQMEGYFPLASELKFSNGIGDTLILPVEIYSRTSPRTLSNNPLSVGGTGSKPVCYETYEVGSTYLIPIYWSFKLTVSEDSKTTEIDLTITETQVSTNSFNKIVYETPSKIGDYKVFGDTIIMPVMQPVARFTEAQLIYGKGLVKLHDVVKNCDWTRIW